MRAFWHGCRSACPWRVRRRNMVIPLQNDAMHSLIDLARPLLGEIALGRSDMSAATVACAIRSASGRTYTGVCVHLSCGIGFCAEHAAVAGMIKGRETQIESIVAICDDGASPRAAGAGNS